MKTNRLVEQSEIDELYIGSNGGDLVNNYGNGLRDGIHFAERKYQIKIAGIMPEEHDNTCPFCDSKEVGIFEDSNYCFNCREEFKTIL